MHFLSVHHTWLGFTGHNPEGAMQEYQELCGTQLLLVYQWKFLRFEAGLNTYFDTMFNFEKLDHEAYMNSNMKEDYRREIRNLVTIINNSWKIKHA